ncbi:MAG TPA: hypothetical protein VFH80_00890 [Solirubrobacteraceae bacterium]|nr:hypothetical protein [Solirubrobacteraceae bacterium]
MTTATLTWLDKDSLPGNLAAVLDMTRRDWEALGASFAEVDDGEGDVVAFAVGCIPVAAEPTEFGVLIDDDEVSRLIVGGPIDSRPQLTAAIIRELVGLHAIDPAQVLHITGQVEEPASTEDKVEYLAEHMRAFEAAVAVRLNADQLAIVGDLQDLRILPGLVTSRDADVAEIKVRVTAADLREAALLLASEGDPAPLAQMRSFDPASRTATVLIGERIVVQLSGLTHQPDADDQISILLHPGGGTSDHIEMWRTVVPEPGAEWSPRFERFTFRLK